MRLAVSKTRSRPVYLQRGGETVTLVFEARRIVLDRRKGGQSLSTQVGPALRNHIYVIDREGVRRVPGSKSLAAAACVGLAALALLWAVKRSNVLRP